MRRQSEGALGGDCVVAWTGFNYVMRSLKPFTRTSGVVSDKKTCANLATIDGQPKLGGRSMSKVPDIACLVHVSRIRKRS